MGTLQQLGKGKERRLAARMQAVDGKWPKEWPPVTSTGRVGNLEEDKVPLDTLSLNYGGEAKSSASKAKDPGHRISKHTLSKAQKGAKKFGVRWVYMIDLPYCEKGHMISEQQHFRFIVMERLLRDRCGENALVNLDTWVDKEINRLLEDNCEECHR